MTPEQREAQTAAAHEATRGRKATLAERCKFAASGEKNPPPMSAAEQLFAGWLNERHTPYRREVSVGPYNLDFTIGSIAVEILGGNWHSSKVGHIERTPYILNQNWSLIFLWHTACHPMTPIAADRIVTLANQMSGDPPIIGKYWVIRGDAYCFASGSGNDNQFTLIPPPTNGHHPGGFYL